MRKEERISRIQKKADIYEIYSRYDHNGNIFIVIDESINGLGCFVKDQENLSVGTKISFIDDYKYIIRWSKQCIKTKLVQLGLESVIELNLEA